MIRPLLAILILLLCGCSSTRTSWNALGSYSASLGDSDSTLAPATGGVSPSDGITRFERTRMCDIRNISIGLPFNPVRGEVAAVRVNLPQALCRLGSHAVTGGLVQVWNSPGTDTAVVTGVPATGWTVSGTVTITDYINFDPPEPELNETLQSERVTGTFEVTAAGPEGEMVRFRNGTFQLDITVTKSPYNPFD
jgi:hypothetical protein